MHINKGRLHAFRKVTNEMVPEDDCHCELRKQLVENHGWQFVSFSPEGINREATSALECQLLVDKRIHVSCLAFPRACLLALGKSCLPVGSRDLPHMFDTPRKQEEKENHNALPGLTPSLLFVLTENIKFIRDSLENIYSTRGTLQLAPRKDTAFIH